MSPTDQDEESSGHERWIISYADLVTLLFAFFTVMYSISVVNISKYKVVSESVSVAMGGKERTRTYPALTQEPLDPMNPQRDFINDIAFAVQPSRGDMPDRELLLSRIALLNQQQQSLALYIKPDSTLHNAITKPSNMQRIDAKAVLTKFGDHLLIVQNNLIVRLLYQTIKTNKHGSTDEAFSGVGHIHTTMHVIEFIVICGKQRSRIHVLFAVRLIEQCIWI